jgi:hypothetical protein
VNPTSAQRNAWSKRRRATMARQGRCLNDNRQRTHGPPVKRGGICAACVEVLHAAQERLRRARGEKPRSEIPLSPTGKDTYSRGHRAAMVEQGRCINDNRQRTHGPPVNGGRRCKACVRVHRRSNRNRAERAARKRRDPVPLKRPRGRRLTS